MDVKTMHTIEKLIDFETGKAIEEIHGKPANNESGSMSELLWDGPSRQSFNITFGHVIERALKTIIPEKYRLDLTHISLEDGEGRTQLDIIFRKEDTIYYFESKNNINLDTEKMPACLGKISRVKTHFEKAYPSCKIVAQILTGRYGDVQSIPKKFFVKGLTSSDVIGYNEFFGIIGEKNVSKVEWKRIIRKQGIRFEESKAAS